MRYGELALTRFGETANDFGQWGPYPVRSFTRQFLELLFVDMSNVSHPIRDINNISVTVPGDDAGASPTLSIGHTGFDAQDIMMNFCGADGLGAQPGVVEEVNSNPPLVHRAGIVLGTSSTAVGVSDYRMEGHIVHGTGGNQFIHYGTWGYNITVASGTASFVIERVFRQDSNGSVTINEMGLYAAARSLNNNFSTSYCIVRDVLGTPVTISSGQFLRATYTFQVSE